MKKSQKLIVTVENVTMVVRFEDVDEKLLPIIEKLEKEGDTFGAVGGLIEYPGGMLFVSVRYADKTRGSTKKQLFGYEQDEFLKKQY